MTRATPVRIAPPRPESRRSAAEIVAAVERALQALAEAGGEHLPVADALGLFVGGVPLADALGLPAGWRCAVRRERRDAALVDLAQRYFPTARGALLARQVAVAGSRYEASGWTRDRRAGRRPDGMSGAIFDVLMLGSLPGEDRLRQIFQRLDLLIKGAGD